MANPDCSLTVLTLIICIGYFKSATIFLTTINCCKSFSPKYALLGFTILNNNDTTVNTPPKKFGLEAPSIFGDKISSTRLVEKFFEYISSFWGIKTTSTFNFDPSNDPAGVYTYSITNSPCPSLWSLRYSFLTHTCTAGKLQISVDIINFLFY